MDDLPFLDIPRLLTGSGCLRMLAQELELLGVRKPLIVSDAAMLGLGHLERVKKTLPAAAVFSNTPENPTFAGVDAASDVYNEQSCDGVVALGGGSVIDTAKLVAVVAGHGGKAADFVGRSERVTSATVAVVVIPTTAGTGSDSSPDAGIHPDARSTSGGIRSRHVVPRCVIADPDFTLTLPPWLTAATGIDALSHCVEGYLSKTWNPMADALALEGIRIITRSIVAATENGSDLAARTDMLLASFAGGVAIAKGLGPAHAIAISCGDQGLHHGMLSALGLVASLRVMRREQIGRETVISEAMGVEAGTSAQGLLDLMKRLDLPTSLSSLGYTIGDIDILAESCFSSHFNLTSPFVPSAQEYRTMIEGIL